MTDRPEPRYYANKAPGATLTNLVATCDNGLTFILSETGIGVLYPGDQQAQERWFRVQGDSIYSPVTLKVNRDGTRLLIEQHIGLFYANINPYEEYPERHPIVLIPVPILEESKTGSATYSDAQFVPGTRDFLVYGYRYVPSPTEKQKNGQKDGTLQKIVLVNLRRWDAYEEEEAQAQDARNSDDKRKEALKEAVYEIKVDPDEVLRAIRFAPHATRPLVRLCLFYLTSSESQGRIHIVLPLLTPDQENAANTVEEIVKSANRSGVPEKLVNRVNIWKQRIEMNESVVGMRSPWNLLPGHVVVDPEGSFEFLDDYVVFVRKSSDSRKNGLVMYSLENVDMWPLLVNENPKDMASVANEEKLIEIPYGEEETFATKDDKKSKHIREFFNQKPLLLQRIGKHRLIGKHRQGLFQILPDVPAKDGTSCVGIPLIFSPENPIMGFGGDLFCIVAPGHHVRLSSYSMCCEAFKSGDAKDGDIRPLPRFDPNCKLDSTNPWAKTIKFYMEELVEEIEDKKKKIEAAKKEKPVVSRRESHSSRLGEVKQKLEDLLKDDGPVSTLIKDAQKRKTVQSKTEELFDQILDDLEKALGKETE